MYGDTPAKGQTDADLTTKMDETSMDQMVQAASIPSLGTLFKRGKERGLLKPQQEYGHTT